MSTSYWVVLGSEAARARGCSSARTAPTTSCARPPRPSGRTPRLQARQAHCRAAPCLSFKAWAKELPRLRRLRTTGVPFRRPWRRQRRSWLRRRQAAAAPAPGPAAARALSAGWTARTTWHTAARRRQRRAPPALQVQNPKPWALTICLGPRPAGQRARQGAPQSVAVGAARRQPCRCQKQTL